MAEVQADLYELQADQQELRGFVTDLGRGHAAPEFVRSIDAQRLERPDSRGAARR
jgi:hypothetical protein